LTYTQILAVVAVINLLAALALGKTLCLLICSAAFAAIWFDKS
jgi:hypothetical protein